MNNPVKNTIVCAAFLLSSNLRIPIHAHATQLTFVQRACSIMLFSSYSQNIKITKTDCHGAITSVYISTQLNGFPMQGVCIIQGESMAESPMILENTSQTKSRVPIKIRKNQYHH